MTILSEILKFNETFVTEKSMNSTQQQNFPTNEL